MYALLDKAQVQMAVVRTYCGVYSCLTLFSGLHLGQLKSQILQTGWVSRSEALALPWCMRWEEVRHPPPPPPDVGKCAVKCFGCSLSNRSVFRVCITMVSGIVSSQSGCSVKEHSGNNMLKGKTSDLRLGVVTHICVSHTQESQCRRIAAEVRQAWDRDRL